MNAGIHDATNLGWKLASATRAGGTGTRAATPSARHGGRRERGPSVCRRGAAAAAVCRCRPAPRAGRWAA
jgi:hypothetical protein